MTEATPTAAATSSEAGAISISSPRSGSVSGRVSCGSAAATPGVRATARRAARAPWKPSRETTIRSELPWPTSDSLRRLLAPLAARGDGRLG